MKYSILPLTYLLLVNFAVSGAETGVKAWEETITLLTYKTNEADLCPVFFQNQSYQGASRVSYPYPQMDNLSMEKIDGEYKGLFLENEYIKVCVLPEIGGRLFYATDKTNGYEMFYRQHVIKPALIGMTGAWISGGIEFCVFHHHRASTHMPVDYRLTENEDGSKTIFIGEFEPRHRMRWTIGISLYPGKSYVQVDGTLINATENVNSFLYWANVATHVNDDYQVIFPPSVQYAVYHAKNSFSHWPITTETYNGHDYYKNNIDASWWKNHPQGISFFAHDLKEGFLAGYDYGKDAGTIHVGNPHIVKGAKLWEWGKGNIWDTEILTDDDGPYAELMVGAYSDNQPDYSWIKPYETKKFQQNWYPLRKTKGVKNANLDAAVNLEVCNEGMAFIGVNTSSIFQDAKVVLEKSGKTIFEKTIDIDPAKPFTHEIAAECKSKYDLKLKLLRADGSEIISYQPKEIAYSKDLPETVKPPAKPEDIKTNEELYYTGMRIRQFHNARLNPADYFLEALKRDPSDVRCNTAMGIIYKEKGDFEAAKEYLDKAIKRLTDNYTRPRDCEPLYLLGVILKDEGNFEKAVETLYRSAWDYEFRSASYFKLAQVYTMQKDYVNALDAVENSLAVNGLNLNALCLKASLLRLTGKVNDAKKIARQIHEIDKLNAYAFNELSIMTRAWIKDRNTNQLKELLRDYPENYLEQTSYYMASGLYEDAAGLLYMAVESENETLKNYPTIHYYLGFLNDLTGREKVARKYFNSAMVKPIDYCFPFRLESVKVYETALKYNASDSRACYYLGNLLYDKQPEKAIEWWQKAVKFDPNLAMAHRNLGWGYEDLKDIDKAIDAYYAAIRHDPKPARYYLELDELLERRGDAIAKRLALLTQNHEYVEKFQESLMREIQVLILAGRYDRAIELIDGREFYRQEGAEELHDHHVNGHLLRGLRLLENGKSQDALGDFLLADTYPENQNVGRADNYEGNPRIYYYTAKGYEAKGEARKAKEFYEKASSQKNTRNEMLYYKAMSLTKLDKKDTAEKIYEEMIKTGNDMLKESGDVDFFAKFGSGPRDKQRKANAYLMIGLGYKGKADDARAQEFFKKSVDLDVNQIWARVYLK